MGDRALLDRAVAAAEAAQPGWAATNPQRRARVLFRFKELVKRELEALAHLLASEHGKVVADARGDVQRGLDRSEEHTSELQSLMRISYAVFCLKKKKNKNDKSLNYK